MFKQLGYKSPDNISRFYFFLRVILIMFIVFCTGYFLFSKANRLMFSAYFSTKCKNYIQTVYSRKLNDRVVDYSSLARQNGIKECRNEEEIRKRIKDGKLVKVKDSRQCMIETMAYSYPYLTKESELLIEEIGKRFKEKTQEVGLKGSKFIITSMTRTAEKMNGLRKTNGNLSENSPHLNGNAFDISYARFSFRKLFITECDKWYLKEALAEVIWELREEKKCWATYERVQGCFHVVSR